MGQITGVAVDPAGNLLATDSANDIVVRVGANGILTVIAGNGIEGFSGDGGPATGASLDYPDGVTTDSQGSLYIADRINHRVRKVSPDGGITAVAGNGVRGFSGDGGPARAARLNDPSAVAVDTNGTLYICDRGNNRIRRVDSSGIITTIAGTSFAGFSGDGGPASSAALDFPVDITLDAGGNLYIADWDNQRIRRVSPSGIITTVAGNGIRGFSGDGGPARSASINRPEGVAVDSAGNLFIADSDNQRVRKVTAGGTITTVAGNGTRGFSGDGGPATSASLSDPDGVAVDRAGNLYIADPLDGRVRRVSPDGAITTVAGNRLYKFAGDGGPATSAAVRYPEGVALDAAGNLFIADSHSCRIRKITPGGIISTIAGNGSVGYSGDGGPATSAAMNIPGAVAVDGAGNVYIADFNNHRIRKVTPAGIITTVAGNGTMAFSGDGGQAVNAALSQPSGVAVDAAGNLFIADSGNNRVRKVTPAGIISTAAGNGTAAFFGDNGPAVSAALNTPAGVAVDLSGNVYITDRRNTRVRRVDSSGTIRTIAGSGSTGFSGDGGPAISASLSFERNTAGPAGVAVDGSGNLYIADRNNNRIRKVSPSGIITTVAGNGARAFSGDGGPATSASLDFPYGVAADSAGNVYIADTVNDRIRRVQTAAPAFSLAPSSLAFAGSADEKPVNPQQISVISSATGLAWTAQVTTQSGGNWLSVSPASGIVPGSLTAAVNVSGLAPGTYRGTITVRSVVAAPPIQTAAVELVVAEAAAARLSVEPSSLNFEGTPGGAVPPAQTLRIANLGGGSLNWTARAETSGSGNWLSVAPVSGTAGSVAPGSVQVAVNAAGLAPGVHSGVVRVQSATTAEARSVPVTLLLSPSIPTVLVSQSGLLFTGVEGAGVVPSQTVGILNVGRGTMSWTARAETLSGGNWLTVTPANGASDAGSTKIPEVEIGISLGSLRAGQYSGLIRVEAPGAANSPQFVTVDLNVLPAGSNPGALVRPTGLIFAAQAGTSSPGSQNVRLSTAAPGSVEARSGMLTFDGADWLESLPRNLVFSPTLARSITIQPKLGPLAPNIYRAALTLLFADSSPTQTVNILFVVVAAVGAAAHDSSTSQHQCAPLRLLAVQRSLGSNFAAAVGWPALIEAQVVDDCGNAVNNATVVASFSSGDPPLPLVALRDGIYTGTWRPVNARPQVAVTVRATLAPLARAEVQALVGVGSNPTAPALFSGGVVNGASFGGGGTLSPGSIVSIFGRNLAQGLNHASRLPLEKTLGGATLNVSGVDVPLFFSSPDQVNAQLPFELTPNSRPQVVIKTRRDGGPEILAVPETITIAAVRPGIFSVNQAGTGQGAILDRQGRLVDSSTPAAAGDVVQIFCTGLGAVLPGGRSGDPAPSTEPLARVTAPVEALVGGRPAVVHFAGLAPGFVGLYQVNIQIPAGVEPGAAVPLVLTQGEVPSNTVTLAIR